MAEPLVFKFEFTDEEGPSQASPGAAARAGAGGTGPQPTSQPGQPQQPRPRQPGRQEPESLAQAFLDAIQRASKLSSLGPFARAGAGVFRPLADIATLFGEFRRGRATEGPPIRPGAAATQPLPTASPVAPVPQTFTISQAVFHAEGARILINGGQVVVARSPTGTTPSVQPSRQFPPGLPAPRPSAPSNLPAIAPPRGVPTSGGPSAPSNLPVPAQIPVIQVGASGGAVAAEAAPALGAAAGAAASLVLPLTALVVATGAAVVAMRLLWRRSTENAKALAAYDATLAAAQARAQVARLQQNIQSARFLGPELSRLTATQTRLSLAGTRIVDILEKRFLQEVLPLLEGIASVAEQFEKFMESEAGGITSQLISIISRLSPGGAIWEGLKGVSKATQKDSDKRDLARGDFYAIFQDLPDLELDAKDADNQAGIERTPFTADAFGPVGVP